MLRFEGRLSKHFFYDKDGNLFKPDWKAFYEACDKDTPIAPVIDLLKSYLTTHCSEINHLMIWSGRCESVRDKTVKWLNYYLGILDGDCISPILKMRPIGDSTPDDVLKERWLDEAIAEGKTIECVYDDRPKVLRMWQYRGVFTFDVGQGKGEF